MWNIIVLLSLAFVCPTLSDFNTVRVTAIDGQPNDTDFEMSPFIRLGNKFYYIELKQTHNWFDALHQCRRLNAHLAFIESAHELHEIGTYLAGKVKANTQWFWISGNDLVRESSFYSVTTGQPLTFTDWSVGQPDNKGGVEDCVYIWLSDAGFKMNDWNCEQNGYHICQLGNPQSTIFTVW